MAAGGRASQAEVDASDLNNIERLILCQAVYEYSSSAWSEVARVLSTHPMISRPKNFFSAQTCSAIYTQLMVEAQLECSDALAVRHAPVHKQLARIHWRKRVTELQGLIAAEDARFKTLVSEIEDIRSGRWDDKIRAGLGLPSAETIGTSAAQTPETEAILERDVPAPAGMQVSEDVVDQGSTEPTTESHIEEVGTSQDIQSPDLTPIDTAGRLKVLTKPSGKEDEQPAVIDLTVEGEPQEFEEIARPKTPEYEDIRDEDVDMALESKSSSAHAASPSAPLEEEPDAQAVEVENAIEGQTGQDEELPPPTSAESPETALADILEDTNQAKRGESAVSTPGPDEPQRADISQGKRKATELDDTLSDSQRDRKRAREESELGDEEEAAPSPGPRRRIGRPPAVDNPAVSKRFQNMIGMLHSQISQHRYGNIFHNPIRKAEAPDYHDIVKRPMDLKTIKARIKDGLITNSLEFQRDVYLMLANAMMYNRPGSDVHHMAEEMMQESEVQINTFRQTEGFHRM